jgi:hypothetical protein
MPFTIDRNRVKPAFQTDIQVGTELLVFQQFPHRQRSLARAVHQLPISQRHSRRIGYHRPRHQLRLRPHLINRRNARQRPPQRHNLGRTVGTQRDGFDDPAVLRLFQIRRSLVDLMFVPKRDRGYIIERWTSKASLLVYRVTATPVAIFGSVSNIDLEIHGPKRDNGARSASFVQAFSGSQLDFLLFLVSS